MTSLPPDLPLIWLDRDPRNPKHVAGALRMIFSLGGPEMYATERTRDELREVGLKVHGLRIGNPKQVDVLIGGFFFLEDGLLYPDNILVTCATCRTALQVRPHSTRKARVLCCFCCLDEVLKSKHPQTERDVPRAPPR